MGTEGTAKGAGKTKEYRVRPEAWGGVTLIPEEVATDAERAALKLVECALPAEDAGRPKEGRLDRLDELAEMVRRS